jgi:uncharacterized repeat protein (TIGR03803 family)
MIDLNHSRKLAVRRRARCLRVPFLLPVVVAGFGSVLPSQMSAQTLTTVHKFTGGEGPFGVFLSGKSLYGTTTGTVFTVNTDGTGFTNLHNFSASATNSLGVYTNSDGLNARVSVLAGDSLYGTASNGGAGGGGTVFAVHTDGTGFTNLHNFTQQPDTNGYFWSTNSDGLDIRGSALSGATLYGMAFSGGGAGNGTLFAVNTDGSGFTTLHTFSALSDGYPPTNSDGAHPENLLVSGHTLYGTASTGGRSGYGTVFKVNTDATGFTVLYSFTNGNVEGFGPISESLILSGNVLYGATLPTPEYSPGTIYKVNPDGTAFTILRSDYSFLDPSGLLLSGNTLYWTESGDPCFDYPCDYFVSALLSVKTDGTGFTNVFNFADEGVGGAIIAFSGNTLYWTGRGPIKWTFTGWGQTFSLGDDVTVFSLSFAPQLTITPSRSNIILSWPTNYAGFDYAGYHLQSTTNLRSSAIWSTNLPTPVVMNGLNTVTNPISGMQQFFRLSQ